MALKSLTIHDNFERASADELSRFNGVQTGFICDAMGRTGAMGAPVRCLTPGVFCGPALTVQTVPRDNLAPWAALSIARPGDILVVSVGPSEASVMGDGLIGMAGNAGIAGVVTDGLLRDIAGIEATGVPCFAAGLSPNSPHKNGPGAVGLPVSLGGVVIAPGDVVVGDRDGVVVIPKARIAEVAAALDAILEKEQAMDRAVREGAKYPAWLKDRLAKEDVRIVS